MKGVFYMPNTNVKPHFETPQKEKAFYSSLLTTLNKKTIRLLDNEDNDLDSRLNERCSKGTKANELLSEIKYILTNFQHIDSSTFETSPKLQLSTRSSHEHMENSRDFFDAMTYAMYEIAKTYSTNAVFINMTYSLDIVSRDDAKQSDKQKNFKVEPTIVSYHIDDKALGYFLYHVLYKNRLMASFSKSENAKPYYSYNETLNHWEFNVGRTMKNKEIKNYADNLCDFLNYDYDTGSKNKKFSVDRAFNNALKNIRYVKDNRIDYLEKFTQAFPQWVQFEDLIYDLREHKVAKAQPFFKLKQYHDYRIPTGLTDDEMDNLPIDDELNGIDFENGLHDDILKSDNDISRRIKDLFVDCTITKEEVRKKADIVIRRMSENFSEDKHEFVLSVLGNLFYHSSDWAVILFVRGGAGIGKSALFNYYSEHIIQDDNYSNINQIKLENDSRFIENAFYGKEFNLIGELNGDVLHKNVIQYFKDTLSNSVSIEEKGGNHKSSKIYAKVIALGNDGQIPTVKTTDANDGGLKRRIVLIDCLKEPKTNDFFKDYPMDKMRSAKTYFAMLCMMTFNAHQKDIAKFQHPNYGGCSNRVIDGFTSTEMVKSTQKYFASHDRYRKFMCTIPDRYRDYCKDTHTPSAEFMEEPSIFRKWLNFQTAKTIKDWFYEWYSEEYPHSNINKDRFAIYLEDTHNIKEKARRYEFAGKSKVIRGYGESFTELVEEVVYEDAPYLTIGHNSELDDIE